ncbi:type VII secretion integral membrane protein EccD [Streptomyces sp. NPDC059373]
MTAATGFCRVTVAAPEARIDVALPEDVALVDLYPEILRLSGQSQPEGAPTGYHLVRRDGTVLDAGRSLAEQRILDGDLLLLRPFAQSLPSAVYDDVSDAIASAVSRDRRRWSDDLMQGTGLTAGVLLLVMMAFALWFADPVKRDMHSLQGIIAGATGVLLVALAGVRARVYEDRASSIALGLAALPHLLLAGSGIFPVDRGEGPGRLHFLVGCVVVLIASVLLVGLLPQGDSPFVAAAFLAVIGTLATFAAVLTDAAVSEVAAVTAVGAIAVVAWLPALSARFARLPIGFRSPDQIASGRDWGGERGRGTPDEESVDFARIGAQARRGHELLLGLVAGCATVVVGSAGVVLGFSDNHWAQGLALAAGIATMLRARLFHYTSQVVCLLVAGILTVMGLILGLALNPPTAALVAFLQGDGSQLSIRIVWFAGSIAIGAALLVGVGLIVPRKGVSPFWGRMLDVFDATVLLSLIPLALAVLNVYAMARSMTS